MLFDELGCPFFGISADLSDEGDAVGVGVVLEPLEQVFKVEAYHGVSSHADSGRLSESGLREVIDHFVGERAASTDDAGASLLEDVGGHDAHEAFSGGDESGAVGSDELGSFVGDVAMGVGGILYGHAFGDAYDELDAAVGGFEHGILGEGCGDEDDGGVGSGGLHGLFDGVEYGYAVHLLSGFSG